MTEDITRREWEALSAYLDGELNPRDRVRLEKKLNAEQNLRSALTELQRTRSILLNQPIIRAPRNFTLSSSVAGVHLKKRPLTGLFNSLRLASAFAGVLFVLVILGDVFLGSQAGRGVPMSVDTQAIQEFAQPVEEASVEEAPVAETESIELPLAMQVEKESEGVMGETETPDAGIMRAIPPGVDAGIESVSPTAKEADLAPTVSAYPSAEEAPIPTSQAAYPAIDVAPEPTTQAAYPAPTQPLASTPSLESPAESGLTLQGEEARITESVEISATDLEQIKESEITKPGFWTTWRFLEVGLIILGLIAAMIAIYLRQTGRA